MLWKYSHNPLIDPTSFIKSKPPSHTYTYRTYRLQFLRTALSKTTPNNLSESNDLFTVAH